MIKTLNNILLGLLAVVLIIGIFVIVRGAFIIGILAMAFLANIIVTWLFNQVMKREERRDNSLFLFFLPHRLTILLLINN